MSNLENDNTIQQWANTYHLTQQWDMWWKNDALVVASNNNLKRGVISAFHDPPYRGHPGIAHTHTLLSANYWWPSIKKDMEEYIKGCTVVPWPSILGHVFKLLWIAPLWALLVGLETAYQANQHVGYIHTGQRRETPLWFHWANCYAWTMPLEDTSASYLGTSWPRT